jgi:hypothetical protein
LSVISCQLSVISCQLSVVSCQSSVVSRQSSVGRRQHEGHSPPPVKSGGGEQEHDEQPLSRRLRGTFGRRGISSIVVYVQSSKSCGIVTLRAACFRSCVPPGPAGAWVRHSGNPGDYKHDLPIVDLAKRARHASQARFAGHTGTHSHSAALRGLRACPREHCTRRRRV